MSHVNFLRHKITNQNIRFGSISVENETFCSLFSTIVTKHTLFRQLYSIGCNVEHRRNCCDGCNQFSKKLYTPLHKMSC